VTVTQVTDSVHDMTPARRELFTVFTLGILQCYRPIQLMRVEVRASTIGPLYNCLLRKKLPLYW